MLSRILFALMTIALASHAAAGVEGVPPIPGKAFNVEDYTVAGSETLQATFRLKAPYPTSRIMAHYLSGVGPAWTRCESRHPGWQVYVDTSAGTPRVVHQVIRYWVSFKQKKMLSVIVRHYSRGSKVHCHARRRRRAGRDRWSSQSTEPRKRRSVCSVSPAACMPRRCRERLRSPHNARVTERHAGRAPPRALHAGSAISGTQR